MMRRIGVIMFVALACCAVVCIPRPADERMESQAPRSGQWRKVRAEHLRRHPTCAACGGTRFLEVHHCEPYSRSPEKELDPDNLITLCDAPGRSCHYAIGHLLSWRSYNPDVRKDAAAFLRKVRGRPPPE